MNPLTRTEIRLDSLSRTTTIKQTERSYRIKHRYKKLLKSKWLDAVITDLQVWVSTELVFVSSFYNTYKPQSISFWTEKADSPIDRDANKTSTTKEANFKCTKL